MKHLLRSKTARLTLTLALVAVSLSGCSGYAAGFLQDNVGTNLIYYAACSSPHFPNHQECTWGVNLGTLGGGQFKIVTMYISGSAHCSSTICPGGSAAVHGVAFWGTEEVKYDASGTDNGPGSQHLTITLRDYTTNAVVFIWDHDCAGCFNLVRSQLPMS